MVTPTAELQDLQTALILAANKLPIDRELTTREMIHCFNNCLRLVTVMRILHPVAMAQPTSEEPQ